MILRSLLIVATPEFEVFELNVLRMYACDCKVLRMQVCEWNVLRMYWCVPVQCVWGVCGVCVCERERIKEICVSVLKRMSIPLDKDALAMSLATCCSVL